jgi:inorganic pyrophosphatase
MKSSLLIAFFMIFTSCAKKTKKISPVEGKASWLKTSKVYNHKTDHGEYIIHPFFDLVPFASTKDNSINFVMTMPENTTNKYQIDLRSGALFRKHRTCSQKDVWKKYSGDLDRPPYTEGFVPRLLDQLGTPQKIIVFGKTRYFTDFQLTPTRSQRVRVVGAVLQQYCESYPCRGKNKWLSRMVLVAVNQNDPKFKKISHINQLKKKVDWNYIKAYIQNSDGRHISSRDDLPAYRVVGNVGPKEALVNSLKTGHLFKFEEMKSLRDNCQKLYDFLWTSAESVRKDKYDFKKLKKSERNEVAAKTEIFSGNVISAETKSVSKEKIIEEERKLQNFSTYFKAFHKNYKKRFLTCQKFVRDTSINANPRRLWYFSYLLSFLNAEDLGHIYSCSRQAWVENPMQVSGKRMYSTDRHLRNCTSRELDRAFDMSVTLFAGLSRAFQPHYRFIEYDEGAGASHQKIYSWVYNSGDGYSCDKKRYKNLSIFPRDINWESFGDTRKRKRTDVIK